MKIDREKLEHIRTLSTLTNNRTAIELLDHIEELYQKAIELGHVMSETLGQCNRGEFLGYDHMFDLVDDLTYTEGTARCDYDGE